MRYIFILNPAAGCGEAALKKEEIIAGAKDLRINPEFVVTTSRGEAEIICSQILSNRDKDEPIRFYAYGGDGTVNEIVNAAFGHHNIEVGVFPYGSGNDFVRNFSDKCDFYNFEKQILGESIYCDLIKYQGISDNNQVSRYCINMFNIGFDCNVVAMKAKLSRLPLIKGSFAYLMGVLVTLFKMKGTNLNIELDNGEVINKEILLVAIGNGSYCGGGVKGLPKADVCDGLIDVGIINKMSRVSFVKLFPLYSKGTHLEAAGVNDILTYRRVKKLKIVPNNKITQMSTDGEITEIEKLEFECIPKSIKIIIPKI